MLSIAYTASHTRASRPRALTAKEKLHNAAVVSMAMRRMHDRDTAEKLFAPEMAEIAELEKRLAGL